MTRDWPAYPMHRMTLQRIAWDAFILAVGLVVLPTALALSVLASHMEPPSSFPRKGRGVPGGKGTGRG